MEALSASSFFSSSTENTRHDDDAVVSSSTTQSTTMLGKLETQHGGDSPSFRSSQSSVQNMWHALKMTTATVTTTSEQTSEQQKAEETTSVTSMTSSPEETVEPTQPTTSTTIFPSAMIGEWLGNAGLDSVQAAFLAAFQAEVRKIEEQFDHFKQKNEKLRQENQQLKHDKAQLDDKHAALEKSLETLTNDSTKLRDENMQLRLMGREQETKLQAEIEAKEQKQKQCESLELELDKLRTENRSLHVQLAVLQDKWDRWRSFVESDPHAAVAAVGHVELNRRLPHPQQEYQEQNLMNPSHHDNRATANTNDDARGLDRSLTKQPSSRWGSNSSSSASKTGTEDGRQDSSSALSVLSPMSLVCGRLTQSRTIHEDGGDQNQLAMPQSSSVARPANSNAVVTSQVPPAGANISEGQNRFTSDLTFHSVSQIGNAAAPGDSGARGQQHRQLSPPQHRTVQPRMPSSSTFSSLSDGRTIETSTYGEDLVEVRDHLVLDTFGDRGTFTGSLLKSTGLPHGVGKMQYADRQRQYNGYWKHGRWHQHGHAVFGSGDEYNGEYHLDQYHGYGQYRWKDGRVYEGQFRYGKREGRGRFKWPDGAEYEGDFVNGQREGHGTFRLSDGGRYEGEFRNGEFWGYGVLYFHDGRKYEGQWLNGMADGQGIETAPDGAVRHDGLWRDDQPVTTADEPEN